MPNDGAFSAAGPRVWNYLPTDLGQPDSPQPFRTVAGGFSIWLVGRKRSANPL